MKTMIATIVALMLSVIAQELFDAEPMFFEIYAMLMLVILYIEIGELKDAISKNPNAVE